MDDTIKLTDHETLDAICAILDAQEWNADTLNEISELVRSTGRPIADLLQTR